MSDLPASRTRWRPLDGLQPMRNKREIFDRDSSRLRVKRQEKETRSARLREGSILTGTPLHIRHFYLGLTSVGSILRAALREYGDSRGHYEVRARMRGPRAQILLQLERI